MIEALRAPTKTKKAACVSEAESVSVLHSWRTSGRRRIPVCDAVRKAEAQTREAVSSIAEVERGMI